MSTTRTMTQKDLLKVCNILAKKYRSTQELDDLISEGYLAGLESIQNGDPKENTYTIIRKAMHSYFNVKLKPVSVPTTGAVLSMVSAIARGTVPEDLSGTQMALLAALMGVTDEVKPNTLGATEDPFEQDEGIEHLLSVAGVVLNEIEASIIKATLEGNKGAVEITEDLQIARSTFNRNYKNAVEKLKGVI